MAPSPITATSNVVIDLTFQDPTEHGRLHSAANNGSSIRPTESRPEHRSRAVSESPAVSCGADEHTLDGEKILLADGRAGAERRVTCRADRPVPGRAKPHTTLNIIPHLY